MTEGLLCLPETEAQTITVLTKAALPAWLDKAPTKVRGWAETTGFRADVGQVLTLPDAQGKAVRIVAGLGDGREAFAVGALPKALPPGTYRLRPAAGTTLDPHLAALAWVLGQYRFDRYKRGEPPAPRRLAVAPRVDLPAVESQTAAITLVRDLVNTPAQDMGPADLAEAAQQLAQAHGAACTTIVGEDLLTQNYPAIHAVGRAGAQAPRLIDLTWGKATHPRLTLVGKGVTFDTGGLNLKPSSAMKLMKKDMGGAAHVLGLARMIMAARLPVRLRVLIPAVENAVAGNAFRPMDVIPTRAGLTIEVGHTDAEGRVILADALAEAARETPDLIIDMATLTGAARVALGPDLPPLYSSDDTMARDLVARGLRLEDPLWQLPLWQRYAPWVEGNSADLTNAPDSPFAGSIIAALFLRRFVPESIPWIHLDVFAWTPKARPGRPEGGEAQGIRTMFSWLASRYGTGS